MVEILPIAVIAFSVLYGLQHLAQKHQVKKAWRKAARSLDLTRLTERSSFRSAALLAETHDGLRVRFEDYGRLKRKPGTRVVVDVPIGFGDEIGALTLRPEGRRLMGDREIEVGDETFDDAFYIGGTPAVVFAALDSETRRTLLAATKHASVRLESGQFRGELRDESPRVLQSVAQQFLAAAARLTNGVPIADRLAQSAVNDPEFLFRWNCLLLLIREFRQRGPTEGALRAACKDENPDIRLRAAIEIGSDGHAVLLELAERTTDDSRAAEAIEALGDRLPAERVRAFLTRALEEDRQDTARACVTLLGSSRDRETVDLLAKLLAAEDRALAVAAATALGATSAPSGETPLLLALDSDSLSLRIAAAQALGKVGTVAAVLRLKEEAERAEYVERDLYRAVRQAIAEIQERASGAAPGQLSVAAGEAGHVSFADTEAGRVSMTPDEPGD